MANGGSVTTGYSGPSALIKIQYWSCYLLTGVGERKLGKSRVNVPLFFLGLRGFLSLSFFVFVSIDKVLFLLQRRVSTVRPLPVLVLSDFICC